VAPTLNILFVISAIAAPLAWLYDPWVVESGPLRLSVGWGWKPILVPLALLVVRSAIRRPPPPLWLKRCALAIASPLLLLTLCEALLKRAGVEADLPPMVIQGESRDLGHSMISDARLLWRYAPGGIFNGRKVNQLGYLDREVPAQKPPGSRRVICLGDSCSAQGIPPYSGLLHERLAHARVGGPAWEAFNMAVHGYSVRQGLRLFELEAHRLQPDVVTIYFGWNDHWLCTEDDRSRMRRAAGPFAGRLANALLRKRTVCLLAKATGAAKPREERAAGDRLRVPHEDYGQTLGRLIDVVRAAGALPVVITAPRASKVTSLLVRQGHTRSQD
jgi:lysophospholipase L1-like esterase